MTPPTPPAWPTGRAPSFQDSPSAHVAHQCAMKEAYAARLRYAIDQLNQAAATFAQAGYPVASGALLTVVADIGPLPKGEE